MGLFPQLMPLEMMGGENAVSLTQGKHSSNGFNFSFLERARGIKASYKFSSLRNEFNVCVSEGKNTLSATISNMGDFVDDVAYIRVIKTKKETKMEVINGTQVPPPKPGFKTQALIKVQGENIKDDGFDDESSSTTSDDDKCCCCSRCCSCSCSIL